VVDVIFCDFLGAAGSGTPSEGNAVPFNPCKENFFKKSFL